MQTVLNTHIYNPFYTDYILGKDIVHQYLIHPQRADWKEISSNTQPDSKIHCRLKEVLINQNKDLGSKSAQSYLADLQEPNSVIVITGQQLGLFTSPMYTIFKAITTLKLAEDLNRQKLPFVYVPVFWLESEDHDFEEVNHFGIWDQQFNPKVLKYKGTYRPKVSLRHYKLEPVIDSLFQQMENHLHDTEFSSELLTVLRDAYTPGNHWIKATREILRYCLSEWGLLFFEPGADSVKEISADFFSEFLDRSTELRQAFSDYSSRIRNNGYTNQVSDISGKTYVHMEDENVQRNHLYASDDKFILPESGKAFSQAEIQQYITENPLKFSTAVASRPLLQSWLLPVAAYVAGPAEIAYWAQLRGLFDCLDIQMPIVYPRINATLVEPKIGRYIKKNQIDPNTLFTKKDQFIDSYFREIIEMEQHNPFAEGRIKIRQIGKAIQKYFEQLDPTLKNVAEKTFDRMMQQFEQLENRAIRAKEDKSQIILSHLEQIHKAFLPMDHPQERFVSVVYFINKFGIKMIDYLLQKLELREWKHQIVDLSQIN